MPSVIIFVVAIYAAMKNNFVISYPLSQFYPFGSIAADNNLPANDDGFTSSIPISVPFPFFGSSYSSVYVNNNGDVTFDAPLSQFTSQAFPISGSHKIIAPFWTDIDTRQGGYLWYRTTIEHTLLQRGTNKIRSLFPGLLHFSATWMMVVTWEDVAAYGCSSSGTILCSQMGFIRLLYSTTIKSPGPRVPRLGLMLVMEHITLLSLVP